MPNITGGESTPAPGHRSKRSGGGARHPAPSASCPMRWVRRKDRSATRAHYPGAMRERTQITGSSPTAMTISANRRSFFIRKRLAGQRFVPNPLRQAASRSRARMTVIADQGLPVGVATPRAFRMRAISRADSLSRAKQGRARGILLRAIMLCAFWRFHTDAAAPKTCPSMCTTPFCDACSLTPCDPAASEKRRKLIGPNVHSGSNF
jgi:hypothetical protein